MSRRFMNKNERCSRFRVLRSLATIFARLMLWALVFVPRGFPLREARGSYGVLFRFRGQICWRFAAKFGNVFNAIYTPATMNL